MVWAGFTLKTFYPRSRPISANYTFADIGLTRSDILFIEGDQYAILGLKQSKANTKHTGV